MVEQAQTGFRVSRPAKAAFMWATVTATAGGKLAVAACALCLALAVAAPWALVTFTDGLSSDPADGAAPEAFMAGGTFLALAVMGAGATWRQRTAGAPMRSQEELVLRGGELFYSYMPAGTPDPSKLTRVAFDLALTRAYFDARSRTWMLAGGGSWLFAGPPPERRAMPDAAYPFRIGDYFGEASHGLMASARPEVPGE